MLFLQLTIGNFVPDEPLKQRHLQIVLDGQFVHSRVGLQLLMVTDQNKMF